MERKKNPRVIPLTDNNDQHPQAPEKVVRMVHAFAGEMELPLMGMARLDFGELNVHAQANCERTTENILARIGTRTKGFWVWLVHTGVMSHVCASLTIERGKVLEGSLDIHPIFLNSDLTNRVPNEQVREIMLDVARTSEFISEE